MEDITKTGAVGLKGLPGINRMQDNSEYFRNLAKMNRRQLNQTFLPEAVQDIDSDYLDQYSYGKSIYDQEATNLTQIEHLNDFRALSQPWYAKALSGTAKGFGLAGTTFVNGTAGLALGITEAIAQGKFSKIWDNEITQAADAFNKSMEEVLPNYYTDYERENPLSAYSLLSSNFLFDKFVKNLGFTIGAFYSGGVYTKALTGLLKGAGFLKGAGQGVFNAFKGTGTLAKEGVAATDQIKALATLGAQTIENSSALRQARAFTGSLMGAVAEGTVEAVSNTNDAIKTLSLELENKAQSDKEFAYEQISKMIESGDISLEEGQQMFNQKMSDIDTALLKAKENLKETRQKAGDAILLTNIPILTLDNMFMFGKAFAGGWTSARNNVKTVARATKEAKRAAAEAAKKGDKSLQKQLKQTLKKYEKGEKLTAEEAGLIEEVSKGQFLGLPRAILGAPIREGNEEMAQAAAAEGAINYQERNADYIYDASLDPESAEQLGNSFEEFWKSVQTGIKKSYGTKNRWEEGLLGALTGALGVPTLGSSYHRSSDTWLGRDKFVGISGGIISDVREYYNKKKDAKDIAEHVNRILHDPKTIDRIRHVSAQISFKNDKNKSLLLNDKKGYKDAETAAIFEEVMYLKRAGRLDLLQKMLSQIEDTTDEEAEQIVEELTKTISAENDNVSQIQNEIDKNEEILGDLYEENETTSNQLAEALLMGDNNAAAVLQQAARATQDKIKLQEDILAQLKDQLDRSNPKKISDFVHEDGTPYTVKEVKEALGDRSERARQMIKSISRIQDKIDSDTNNIFTDEQLATLSYYQVAIEDWINRSTDILKNLKQELGDERIFNVLQDAIKQEIGSEKSLIKNLMREKEISKEEAIALARRSIKNYEILKENLDTIFERPETFITFVARNKEILSDADDGSDIMKVIDLKKWFMEQLNMAIDNSFILTEEQKNSRKKDVEDLGKMVDSIRDRDKIFTEAINNPHSIDQRRSSIESRNAAATDKKLIEDFKNAVDFEDPNSIRETYNKYKSRIKKLGFNNFLKNFSKEEQDKLRKAIKNNIKTTLAENEIDDDPLASGRLKNIAKDILNETTDSEEIERLIKEKAAEEAEAESDGDVVKAAAAIPKIEEELARLAKLGLDAFNDSSVDIDSMIDPKAAEDSTSDVDISAGATNDSSVDIPQGGANDNVGTDTAVELDEEDNYEGQQQKTQSVVKGSRNKIAGLPQQPRQGGYELRRQLTQFYLFGNYGTTILDFYEANPTKIPNGVVYEDYKKYLKNVLEYLNKEGAFTYVSGINDDKLSAEDTIYFEVEDSLTDDKGVKVVVIKKINKQGQPQVVGTIRTKYEFDIYDQSVKDGGSKNSDIEAQRELYNEVIRRHEAGETERITTTVENLFKGSLPVVEHDSTVKTIFNVNDSTDSEQLPLIGVTAPQNKSSRAPFIHTKKVINIAEVDSAVLKNGQIYVLIPTNTGQYIPAMCYSTPISSIIDNKNDWYVQETLKALMKMLLEPGGVAKHKNEFLKWFPLAELSVQYKDADNKKDVNSFEEASYLTIRFKGIDGKPVNLTYSLKSKNGEKISTDALSDKMYNSFLKNTAQKQNIQTNVNKNRLSDNDYVRNIIGYMYVNLEKGIGGQHSMNDGFTYVPTEVESQYKNNGKYTPPVLPPKGTAERAINGTPVMYNGENYTLDSNGVAWDSKGKRVEDPQITQEIINAAKGVSRQPINNDQNSNYKYDQEMTFYGTKAKLSTVENGVAIYKDDKGETILILTAQDDHTYIGLFREPGSDRWSVKMENASGTRDYKKLIAAAIDKLPSGNMIQERTSISIDGLRVFAQQLKHGFKPYEVAGKVETYTVVLNGADKNNIFNMSESDRASMMPVSAQGKNIDEIKAILTPYLKNLGITDIDKAVKITDDNKIKLTLPVLLKSETSSQQSSQEGNSQSSTQKGTVKPLGFGTRRRIAPIATNKQSNSTQSTRLSTALQELKKLGTLDAIIQSLIDKHTIKGGRGQQFKPNKNTIEILLSISQSGIDIKRKDALAAYISLMKRFNKRVPSQLEGLEALNKIPNLDQLLQSIMDLKEVLDYIKGNTSQQDSTLKNILDKYSSYNKLNSAINEKLNQLNDQDSQLTLSEKINKDLCS